jgi:AcrR family transcriptional regulator
MLVAALAILQERGASRLTTREVASRAGVSEGSVFYHFTDRIGLLTSVIEDALSALLTAQDRPLKGELIGTVLDQFMAGVEQFLERALVVMVAAQSDIELRLALLTYLRGNDMGPHRGVRTLASYLHDQQLAGLVRTDVDPSALAFFVYSACFERIGQRHLIADTYGTDLPTRAELAATMGLLIQPPSPIPQGQCPEGS